MQRMSKCDAEGEHEPCIFGVPQQRSEEDEHAFSNTGV